MRRDGWLLAVPLTPAVLTGIFMTVLIIPAILGIPILLVTARPWWLALNVGLGRRTSASFTKADRVYIVACLTIVLVVAVTAAAYGFDDFEAHQDGVFVVPVVAMLLSGVAGSVGLLSRSS